jgi:hypothetical protein
LFDTRTQPETKPSATVVAVMLIQPKTSVTSTDADGLLVGHDLQQQQATVCDSAAKVGEWVEHFQGTDLRI